MPQDGAMPRQDKIDQVFYFMQQTVQEASKGWEEGTFRVTKTHSAVYVDKVPDDKGLPDNAGYRGQVLVIIVPPKAGMAGEYNYNGQIRSFSSVQLDNVLQHLGRAIRDDIGQWALP